MNRFFIVITLFILSIFLMKMYNDIFVFQGEEKIDDTLEILRKNQSYIQKAALLLKINPRIIASIIFSERRLNMNIIDKYENLLGYLGLDTSIGIAQIRVGTGIWIIHNSTDTTSVFCLEKRYWRVVPKAGSREDMLEILQNDSLNIVLAILYVKQMMTYWKKHNFPIDNRVDIIATLYSKGIYKQGTNTLIIPHRYPISNKMGKIAKAFYNSNQL